jgi:uncharacterized protein YggU (UPF0235/DUF167 family)
LTEFDIKIPNLDSAPQNQCCFRQIANRFNNLAKEVSFAGRANKLLFEILEEVTTQPRGQRTLIEGLKTRDGKEILLGFESNKLRPLRSVFKTK